MRPNKLYMVIPCYNEEEVLPETARRLREKLTALMEAGTISRSTTAARTTPGRSFPGCIRRTRSFRGCACPGTGGIRMPCWPA